MKNSYVAYIDESGDEGYQFVELPARKSSEWFIMSAAICEAAYENKLKSHMHWFERARTNKKKPFHFRNADHRERVAFLKIWSLSPFRFVSVFVHKPSIEKDAALRSQKHWLFNYATKLLVERISWHCYEYPMQKQPGKVKLILSKRGQLKLERITNYLGYLQTLSSVHSKGPVPREAKNSIRWEVIDLGLIEVIEHDSLIGLQVADGVASGCAAAVEWSSHLTTEHRFVKIMGPNFYRRGGQCQSYGIKFVPGLPDDDPFGPDRLHWLRRFK